MRCRDNSAFLHFTVTCISETKRCMTRCVTFWTCFVTRNHTVESLCANFFSSYVCAYLSTYIQNVPLPKCAEIQVCMIRTFALPFS